jgi:type VI secretion system secreted protein Hcp
VTARRGPKGAAKRFNQRRIVMAFKAFLKIDGIDGPSPDAEHKKWIELLSFNHSLTQSGSFGKDGQLTGGAPTINDFSIAKEQDVASPLIKEKLLHGTAIPTCIVHLTASIGTGAPHVFAKYEFTPCVVSSYSISGGADSKPMENVTFRFNIYRWEFTPYEGQEAKTTVRSGWDVGQGKKDSSNVSA